MIRGVIQYRGSPDATKKELRDSAKAEFASLGSHWHANMMPGHFEKSAEGKYHYKPRNASYIRRKARKYGHTRPLDYSGEMKRQATRMAKITSTSKGARVTMSGPRYLYMYRKDYKQPDKAAELTFITNEEVNLLAQILDKKITARLNSIKTFETRRST